MNGLNPALSAQEERNKMLSPEQSQTGKTWINYLKFSLHNICSL